MYDQTFNSRDEYEVFLHTKNVSYALDSFISQKMGSDIEYNLQCSFTRVPISKPVRHCNLANIKCIFDFETWVDFFEQRLSSNQTGSFSCPGCKQYTSFSDYGIDFTLFNVLEIKSHFEKKANIKLLKDIIIYSISSGKQVYYGILQQDKQTRVLLPGINPIVRISNTAQQAEQLSPNQQVISDQINVSISKLQNYNVRMLAKCKKLNLNIDNIRRKWEARKKNLVDLFRKSIKLIELGAKSIQLDFVFGFKKLFKDQKPYGSVLIVFYPHLGIWSEYELKTQNFQYEQVLFIKDQTQQNCNIIYAVGGKVSNLVQTNQFLKITFPKDPFTNEKNAVIENLPVLPKDGFNYLGSVYNGQVYIFCGQRKFEGPQQLIIEEIIDKAYVFQNNSWKQINQRVEKRFDGSQIIVQHKTYGKIIILYGGTSRVPDGQIGYANQEQQHIVQVFQFSSEKFLGNGFKLIFSDKPENKYQKFMLCTPIFSVPYGSNSELLIGGEFLKRNWKENKEKFIFNWKTGEIQLSEFQSTQPVEQQLTTYMKRNWSSTIEFVTPIQDMEGAVAYGVYYTIHQTEVIKDQRTTLNIVQLLEYNLANGTLSTRPYATREYTQEQAKRIMANLIQQENKIL